KITVAARPTINVGLPGQRRTEGEEIMDVLRLLPELLERELAIVLAQEVQKLLVVAWIHVEQLAHDLVVAARLLESFADDVAHVLPSNLTLHVERIYGGPERFAFLGELLVEVVGDRASPLALRPQ